MREAWRLATVILALALVCSLIANAALYRELSRARATGGAPAKVRIGTMKAFSYLPLHVAYALGYFEEEGLEVELYFFGSGSKNREALIAGDLDMATLAIVHAMIARAKGFPVRVVGALQAMEFFDVLVRKELEDRVRDLKDLEGLKIGISYPGAGSWAWCLVYLRKAGLDPEGDVELVSVDGIMTMYSALKTGRVDAVVSWNPLTVRALREGIAFLLLNIHDRETHLEYVGSPEALAAALVVREELLEERPEVVEKVLRALNRALEYIHTHDPEEIARVVAPVYEGLDLETLAEAIEYEMPTYPYNVALSESAYEVEADVYLSVGILKERIPFEEVVDWRFAGWRP